MGRGSFTGSLSFVFIFSLIFRLLHFTLSKDFFSCPPPALDEDFYELLAKLKDSSSPLITKEAFYYSPLFSSVVYAFSKITPDYMELLRYMNTILGSINASLMFLILKTFSRDSIYPAILATCFGASDIFLLYDLTSMKVSLGMFLILLFIHFLLNRRFFISGLSGSFAVLIYAGLTLPIIFISLTFAFKRNFKALLLFLVPVIFTVSIVSLINYKRTQDLVLLTAVDGIHFFIGNWKNATGIYTPVPGVRPNPFGHYFDARELAEFMEGRDLKPSEVSSFWKRLALKQMSEDKVKTVKNLLKKLLFVFSLHSIPNNYSLELVKLKTSLWLSIPFYLFIITGLAGLLSLLPKTERLTEENLMLVHVLFLGYFVFLIGYFVTDRYRLPLLIPMFIYTLLFFEIKKSLFVRMSSILLLGLLLAFIIPPVGKNMAKYTLSLHVCRLKEAVSRTEDNKKKSFLYLELADIYIKIGGHEWAYLYLQEALKAYPPNGRARLLFKKLILNYPHKYKP